MPGGSPRDRFSGVFRSSSPLRALFATKMYHQSMSYWVLAKSIRDQTSRGEMARRIPLKKGFRADSYRCHVIDTERRLLICKSEWVWQCLKRNLAVETGCRKQALFLIRGLKVLSLFWIVQAQVNRSLWNRMVYTRIQNGHSLADSEDSICLGWICNTGRGSTKPTEWLKQRKLVGLFKWVFSD